MCSSDLDDFTDPWRNAPYLILQHGNGRSSAFWYRWVPYLARFYKVVRPDVRGLGRSSADFNLAREFTLEHCVGDLLDIIDDLGAQSVHLCGESIGGVLCIALAATQPQRVRTLSLVAAPVYISEKANQNATYGYADRMEAFRKMGSRGWAEASNAGRRFPADGDPGMQKWTVDEMGKGDVELLIAGQRWVLKCSVEPYLERIQAPVLGLYPSHGSIASNDQVELMKRKIPNVRIVNVACSYHMIGMLQPATCANAVLHFAAQHDGTPCHE